MCCPIVAGGHVASKAHAIGDRRNGWSWLRWQPTTALHAVALTPLDLGPSLQLFSVFFLCVGSFNNDIVPATISQSDLVFSSLYRWPSVEDSR